MKNILLVEDEFDSARVMIDTLQANGYAIHHASNIADASKFINENPLDLILMDILLRDGNGLSFTRVLRKSKIMTPIIFVTVCLGITDIRSGYELGCEDYIKKPVNPEELVLRVKRVVGDMNSCGSSFRKIGKYRFNPITQCLLFEDKVQNLGSLESSVLNELTAQSGTVIEKKELLNKYWLEVSYYSSRNLDSVIVKLRKRFQDDPRVHILSLKRLGYRLIVA
ncbi:MAG: response regulator transcription factor [Bacteroidota bacterium]|nr:response regulator transcription factor [Bacteroidota bacterium]